MPYYPASENNVRGIIELGQAVIVSLWCSDIWPIVEEPDDKGLTYIIARMSVGSAAATQVRMSCICFLRPAWDAGMARKGKRSWNPFDRGVETEK